LQLVIARILVSENTNSLG